MAIAEIGLVARARGVAGRLASRATLDGLADAGDLEGFARLVAGRVGLDPLGSHPDGLAIERAAGRAAERHLRTLYRWQQRPPGMLDIFAARQDRRSLRAMLRGAAQGAAAARRLDGLSPTPSLPRLALAALADQATAALVVRHLALLSHPDASRLAPLVRASQVDLLAIDAALLRGFAERTARAAAEGGEVARRFVAESIDAGNLEHALIAADEPRDLAPADVFVEGGRWLKRAAFERAVRDGSGRQALVRLTTALARTPLSPLLPATAPGSTHVDRAFLVLTLARLRREARVDPLGAAPLLRVLLLIEVQSRDLRALAWAAALGAPTIARRQQLLTPS